MTEEYRLKKPVKDKTLRILNGDVGAIPRDGENNLVARIKKAIKSEVVVSFIQLREWVEAVSFESRSLSHCIKNPETDEERLLRILSEAKDWVYSDSERYMIVPRKDFEYLKAWIRKTCEPNG